MLSLIPRLCQVGMGYGFKGLFSPAMSTAEYKDLPSFIPIIGLILLLLLARILACFTLGAIALMVSQVSPSFIFAVMVSALVTGFPLVLYYMDVEPLQYFSVYPLFNISAMITNSGTTFLAFAYSMLCGVIIYFTTDYLLLSYNEI